MDFKLYHLKNHYIIVRYADNDSYRMQGLQGVASLGPNEGCLLDFQAEVPISLWMKGCLVPLSVAFLDKDRKVISITDMPLIKNGSIKIYSSPCCARYALEMSQGFFDRVGIQEGDILEEVDSI